MRLLTRSLPSSLLKSICWNLFKALAFPRKSWVVTICGRVIYVLLSRVICVCFPTQSPQQGKKETVYNFLFFGDTRLVCSCVCTDACVEARGQPWRSSSNTLTLQFEVLSPWVWSWLSWLAGQWTLWSTCLHPCSTGVTAACCCVQLNAWVLRVQTQVPIIVKHTWLAEPTP